MKRLCAAMVAIMLALAITTRAQAQSDAACGAVLCLLSVNYSWALTTTILVHAPRLQPSDLRV